MKICVLSVLHPPFDKRVFQKVATSLARAGYEVTLIVPSESPIAVTQGITFRTISPAKSMLERLLSVAKLTWLGMRERAIVYVAVEPESWVSGLLIKGMSGSKVVFDVHEHVPTEFAKFFPGVSRRGVAWMTAQFMRIFARFTDHIILTRASFDDPFKGLKTPRSVVINTNHLQAKQEEIPNSLVERYGNRPTIIHQGLFGDVRGSWELLEATKIVARAHPDLKVILLGRYEYGDVEEYKRAVEECGLSHVFDFISWVPFEDVPAYIAVSRVGLILFQPGSLNHLLAMPHKLFDYMREAKPTIAPSFALEVQSIVNETNCGILVDVTNPEAIADAIMRLLRDTEEAARLGENGRRAVELKYNWQSDERRLLAVFEEFKKV